jgi:DNA-directed RNA polymerase subunit RPC12/RpoP
MTTIEKTKIYRCATCNKSWTLEWIRGSVTNASLFALHREAPNRGEGHTCKTCSGEVRVEAMR